MQTLRSRAGTSFAFLVLAASGPLTLWACEDDSTPASRATPTATEPTSTPPTPPTPTGTTGTTGTPDGGGEEGGPSGTGELLDVDTLKLTNLSSVPAINGCIRPKAGSADFTGPVFRAEGIPPNSVSARVATNVLGPVQLKVIANGDNCSAPGLYTQDFNIGGTPGSPSHWGAAYVGEVYGTIGGGWPENLVVVPGKESFSFNLTGSNHNPEFVRDDDAGPPVDLFPGGGGTAQVDGNLLGTIVLRDGSDVIVVQKRMRTKAGGTLTMWGRNPIVVCDDSAPSKNGLTDCDLATLRPE
ncbi:MAG TPA: hypothetical protein VM925_23870 [Labilithrix sp.]|nr:hypothetical protein [Labilithrix sp.]